MRANDKENKVLTIELPDSTVGSRLDRALSTLLPDYSRSRIQQWIKSGRVLVDNELVRSRDKIMGGEIVTIVPDFARASTAVAEDIPLEILFEDDTVLVINKPAGLVVHPGAGVQGGTLLNGLLYYDESLSALPRAGIVHRLDKDTTGLMVVAKTESARLHLIEQLESRSLRRQYSAIVHGQMVAGGTIDAPIGRHPTMRTRMAVTSKGKGKEAITHYRILKKFSAHTYIDVRLETGRTHQIRVHMTYIKHPIVGDPVYGGRPRLPRGCSIALQQQLSTWKRQALHARELELVHPDTGNPLSWSAALPEDMQGLLDVLRNESVATGPGE